MAILDIVLLLCFIPAIVSGISKGFVKQVIDFVAILLAAWAAFRFSTVLAGWLGTYVTLDETVLKVICFVLGFFNRLLGLVFGVLKVGLILGLVILLFESLNSTLNIVKPEATENAVVYNALKDVANAIFPILKSFVTGETDAAGAAAAATDALSGNV